MENDKTDQDFEARFEEILKGIPPTPKKGDKISRREVAESIARCLRPDIGKDPVSEDELEEAYAWIDWNEKRREVGRVEKRFQITWVLLLGIAFGYLVISFVYNTKVNGWLFWPIILLALALDVVSNLRKDARMEKFLLENPPPEFK